MIRSFHNRLFFCTVFTLGQLRNWVLWANWLRKWVQTESRLKFLVSSWPNNTLISVCVCDYSHIPLEGTLNLWANAFVLFVFALLSLCSSGHLRHDFQNCDTILLVMCADRTDERQRLLNISTWKMLRQNAVIVPTIQQTSQHYRLVWKGTG